MTRSPCSSSAKVGTALTVLQSPLKAGKGSFVWLWSVPSVPEQAVREDKRAATAKDRTAT